MTLARRIFRATLKPIYVALREAVTRILERRAGIATSRRLTPESLGYVPEQRSGHVPSGWLFLRRILRRSEVSTSDVFIDLGSGMGRVVYQAAASYGFARVIGVELSPELDAVAHENIDRNRARLRCRDVELVCSDVLEYEIPDDVTIVYLNNPFLGDIFQNVIDKLTASVARHPRRLRVLYLNPIEEQRLLGAGFRLMKATRGLRPTAEWARSNCIRIYELDGAPGHVVGA